MAAAVQGAARWAILGGFGLSLGDGVIGLQALFAGQQLGVVPKPTLFRSVPGRGVVDGLYGLARDFAHVEALPSGWPPLDARMLTGRFDRVIDMRDFALNPGFRGVAMIDFFLQRLGVDPARVPKPLLRNSWLAPRAACVAPQGLPQRYVLVCPGSSMPQRDMPAWLHSQIIDILLRTQSLPVVTQAAVGHTHAITATPCLSMATLLGLVAGAAAVISTDTAMVHLADALDVPCLAFFTTHQPQWRVRDYPGCEAVYCRVPNLPQALEFSRSNADLATVAQAWRNHASVLAVRTEAFAARIQ